MSVNDKVTSIITTNDGSHSLLHNGLNETYHSIHGALQESQHVFIKKGFDFCCQQNNNTPIHILEVGFGTGLNVFLTVQASLKLSAHIHLTTLEAYPLPKEIWSALNYTASLGMPVYFDKIHESAWETEESILENFTLKKIHDTLQAVSLPLARYDLIYFDAFAPNKQPDMWTLELLEKISLAMKPGGIFVTYCAKGQLKRDLKSLGLRVETLEGPPGKKEMVRASKPTVGE